MPKKKGKSSSQGPDLGQKPDKKQQDRNLPEQSSQSSEESQQQKLKEIKLQPEHSFGPSGDGQQFQQGSYSSSDQEPSGAEKLKQHPPREKEKRVEQPQQSPHGIPPQGAWGDAKWGPQREKEKKVEQPQQSSHSIPPQGAWRDAKRGPQRKKEKKVEQPQQSSHSIPTQGAWGDAKRGPQREKEKRVEQPQQSPHGIPPQGAWGDAKRGPQREKEKEVEQPQQSSSHSIPPQGAWGDAKWGPQREKEKRVEQPQQSPHGIPPQGAWGDAKRGPQREKEKEVEQPQQSSSHSIPPQGAWGDAKRGPQREKEKRVEQPQQSPRGIPPQGAWGDAKLSSQDKGDKKKAESFKKRQEEQKPFEKQEALIAYPERIFAPKKSQILIKVDTNYFPLQIKSQNLVIYHYDVTFEPDKPNYLLRAAWNKFSKEQFGNRVTVFDGKKNVFSKGPLIKNQTSHSAKVVICNPENEKMKEFNVQMQEVRQVDLSVLGNFRAIMSKEGRMPEAEISILDTILKNWPANKLVQSGRTFFSKMENSKVEFLSDRLDLRFGYFQSAVFCYRPYLNFDIAYKSFYRNCKILDIMKSFDSRNYIDFDGLDKFIRGMKIIYEIPNQPASRRFYRVNKLVENAKNQKFKKEDGSSISVATYFEREKNYKLRFPDYPLLWVGPNQKTIFVPLECCTIAPDQVFKGEMTPDETRKMVQQATLNARDRRNNVYRSFDNAGFNPRTNEYLQEFGIEVSDTMARVDARILNPPSLQTKSTVRVRDGVWRICDFYEPKTLTNWCILNLDQRARREDLYNFQKLVKSKGESLKMNIGDPRMNPVLGDSSPAGLKNNLSSLKNMDLVFVIIPENIKNLYSRVKTICETEESILTQCIKSKTIRQDPRKIGTTIENILLKVNAKLGGKNHCLENRSVPSCLQGYVMIIGADVTHSGPVSKIPSVAAVAVTCDAVSFQYEISYRVQRGEIIQDMEEIMRHHLQNFYNIRKKYPEKIIFFRDGVSEGELNKILHFELNAIKSACREKCVPKITVVVVQKRHHTRLYPTSERDETGKNYNVPVGTCVDTEIVNPKSLDFYLVSHMSLLGTARPTRYRLIYDDNRLTDEQVEELSFFLCHLYARCNRSVSYPSPTYNAHLAAYRVRSYLDNINCARLELPEIQRKITDRISCKSPMFFV